MDEGCNGKQDCCIRKGGIYLFYLSLLFELIFGAPRHLEPPRLYNFRTWVI
jgi:hypothetical protein